MTCVFTMVIVTQIDCLKSIMWCWFERARSRASIHFVCVLKKEEHIRTIYMNGLMDAKCMEGDWYCKGDGGQCHAQIDVCVRQWRMNAAKNNNKISMYLNLNQPIFNASTQANNSQPATKQMTLCRELHMCFVYVL